MGRWPEARALLAEPDTQHTLQRIVDLAELRTVAIGVGKRVPVSEVQRFGADQLEAAEPREAS